MINFLLGATFSLIIFIVVGFIAWHWFHHWFDKWY